MTILKEQISRTIELMSVLSEKESTQVIEKIKVKSKVVEERMGESTPFISKLKK